MQKKIHETIIGAKLLKTAPKDLLQLPLEDEGSIKVFKIRPGFEVVGIFGDVDLHALSTPIVLNTTLTKRVYVDLRSVSYSPKSGKTYPDCINDAAKAEIMLTAGLLMLLWENGEIEEFGYTYRPAFNLLISAMANGITRTFHATDSDASLVKSLIALFYVDSISPDLSDTSRSKVFATMNRGDDVDISIIERQIGSKRLITLDDLVEAIKDVTVSAALSVLEKEHILNSSIRPFLNIVNPDFISIAVEYPPFWIAIMDTIINSKDFRFKMLNKQIKHYEKDLRLIRGAVKTLWGASAENRPLTILK